mgnify:FL=1
MKTVIGYILFVLSFVAWALIALLPFIDITKVQVAAATTFLLISGEVLFWFSLVLLGKEFWQKIKGFFKRDKGPD